MLWAAALLVLTEVGVRNRVWPLATWGGDHDPSFWYGFTVPIPLCREEGDLLHCKPQEYHRISAQKVSATKPESTLRIVTLGGSHALGRDSYTPRTVKRLTELCPAVRWEGLNFAVGGYGTSRMRVLMAYAQQHQPDLWVIDPGGTNEYEDERDLTYGQQLHTGPWRILFESWFVVLGRKSWSDAALARPNQFDGPNGEGSASAIEANLARWHETQRRNLAAMTDTAREGGQPVVLMGRMFPDELDVDPRRRRNHSVLTELEAPDRVVVDSFTTLPEGDRKRFFRKDQNHYSGQGHAHLSRVLADTVLALPLVQERCKP